MYFLFLIIKKSFIEVQSVTIMKINHEISMKEHNKFLVNITMAQINLGRYVLPNRQSIPCINSLFIFYVLNLKLTAARRSALIPFRGFGTWLHTESI